MQQAKEDQVRIEGEIRRLCAEEVQAFLRNDSKALARLWSDSLVVTNPLNKFVSKQQVLGMMESGFLVITAFERDIEYLRVCGDIVIVAGGERVTWGGKMPHAGTSDYLRITAIWQNEDGRWQEIARHANIVPQHCLDLENGSRIKRRGASSRSPVSGEA